MDKKEIMRLSAEACEHDGSYKQWAGCARLWDPFDDPYQRWQCVEKLLEMGVSLHMEPKERSYIQTTADSMRDFYFAPNEVPARALAELHKQTK